MEYKLSLLYSVYVHHESDTVWVDEDNAEHGDPLVEVVESGLDFMLAVEKARIFAESKNYSFNLEC